MFWGTVMRFIVVALTLVACSTSSTTTSTYATPSSICSDGPRWPRGHDFAYERDGPTDAPKCTPHCGGGAGRGGELSSDALPSGTCSENGVVCTMTAEWLGPCPESATPSGPIDVFICRCTNGAWACTVDATAPSATTFSCSGDIASGKDAGADGG